jgi:DNA-binding FrmR family transcriptional regulator
MAENIGVVEEVYLEPELEKDLQDRLSRIAGHVNGIKRMLTEHRDCESILVQ